MPDVLIHGDTVRSPALRHEVPVAIPDPFLYLERNGRRIAVVTAFEIPRIEELRSDLELRPPEEFGIDELLAGGMPRHRAMLEVYARACGQLGVSSALVPPSFPLELADLLRAGGLELRVDHEHFARRRRVKNRAELVGIRRAQRAAEAGMRVAAEMLRRAEIDGSTVRLEGESLTCERIRAEIERAFAANGAVADDFIVAHGAQTAIGHELGSGPIAAGEPVVLDLFPRDRESGCYADMTRTFVLGEAPEELGRYHRLCRQALDRVLPAIRPGVPGSELHRLVCDHFEKHGLPTQLSKAPGEVLLDGFFHSLGHGVGLEVHEEPALGRAGQPLLAGDVVAVEPGLYRSGFGGCRLEDLVLVTEDGAENLTDFPYELEAGA